MLIKSIKFPQTKNSFFGGLEYINNGLFRFHNDSGLPYKFVILIGKNGCGKTKLLRWLWYTRIRHIDNQNIKLMSNRIEELSDDMMIVNMYENNYDYWLKISRNPIFSKIYPPKFYNKHLFVDNPYVQYHTSRKTNLNKSSIGSKEDITLTWEEKYYLTINEEVLLKRLRKILFPRVVNLHELINKNLIKNIADYFSFYRKHPYLKIFLETIENNCGFIIKFNDSGEIFFEKDGKIINFSNLSSGEKHLLVFYMELVNNPIAKDEKNLFLFIDEPENSLYPKQQETLSSKLIEKAEYAKKKNVEYQSFIATHSPFILKKFLNRNDVAIIDVENGENINVSKKKKLLLNGNNLSSYDEVSYLYYDIVSSNYYISLYETMRLKFCELITKRKKTIAQIIGCEDNDKLKQIIKKFEQNGLDNLAKSINNKHSKWWKDYSLNLFLLDLKSLNGKKQILINDQLYLVARIKNIHEMEIENRTKIQDNEHLSIANNLTLLRNMFSHNNKESLQYRIYKDENNKKKINEFHNKWNGVDKTKFFYQQYEKNFDEFLKKQIETIRYLLIKWEKISNIFLVNY